MTEKQSAVAKLLDKRAKEAKEYKTEHDVERVHHLIGALTQLRDQTGASAVAASFARELTALNAKQAALDAEEKEEHEKENREAISADQEAAENSQPKSGSGQGTQASPTENSARAPSVPRR